MVIKTEVCAFSDTRIYPGHGVRMIRRDGQVRREPCQGLQLTLPTSLTIFGSVLVKLDAQRQRAETRRRFIRFPSSMFGIESNVCFAMWEEASSFCATIAVHRLKSAPHPLYSSTPYYSSLFSATHQSPENYFSVKAAVAGTKLGRLVSATTRVYLEVLLMAATPHFTAILHLYSALSIISHRTLFMRVCRCCRCVRDRLLQTRSHTLCACVSVCSGRAVANSLAYALCVCACVFVCVCCSPSLCSRPSARACSSRGRSRPSSLGPR